jgi:hypothetical protein
VSNRAESLGIRNGEKAARFAILEPRNTRKHENKSSDFRSSPRRASSIQAEKRTTDSTDVTDQAGSHELIHSDLTPASLSVSAAPSVVNVPSSLAHASGCVIKRVRSDHQGRIVGELRISGFRYPIERARSDQLAACEHVAPAVTPSTGGATGCSSLRTQASKLKRYARLEEGLTIGIFLRFFQS